MKSRNASEETGQEESLMGCEYEKATRPPPQAPRFEQFCSCGLLEVVGPPGGEASLIEAGHLGQDLRLSSPPQLPAQTSF